MKKILFATNLPAPYRVDFFNELGKYCDLTVLYERNSSSERDKKWVGENAQNFKEIYLKLKPVGVDRSKGSALKNYIKAATFDFLIFTNYASISTMEAIAYCRLHRIPYYVEYDGGFNKQDKLPQKLIKRFLLCGAQDHLTTCDEHISYLKSIGIPENRIHKYPFTSIRECDIVEAIKIRNSDKRLLRQKLRMSEMKIVLFADGFLYDSWTAKGYNTLMKIAKNLKSENIGFYIVGDEPTQELYDRNEDGHLTHVQFIGVKTKDELSEYFAASDLFILSTHGDICGELIKEAMAYSLPVIVTYACAEDVELVQDGENGFVVPVDEPDIIEKRIRDTLFIPGTQEEYGYNSLKKIGRYVIEKKADKDYKIFWEVRNVIRNCARMRLGIKEKNMVLAVGQFIPRKGFDVLIKASSAIFKDTGCYFVGGVPTDEYIELKESLQADTVHFVGFKSKEELKEYYRAADLFVLPTREDIWGLVVNEAMACGLPVISTDRCIAALELIGDTQDGCVIPTDDSDKLASAINYWLNKNIMYSFSNLGKIKQYTIEKMAECHLDILKHIEGV